MSRNEDKALEAERALRDWKSSDEATRDAARETLLRLHEELYQLTFNEPGTWDALPDEWRDAPEGVS